MFTAPRPRERWGKSESDFETLAWKHEGAGATTVSLIALARQGVLDTGKKLSDDNTIGKEEIQQRLAQFVEHWKELKQLAAAR